MNPRKNDILASNLLFVVLAISVGERLFWMLLSYWYPFSSNNTLVGRGALVWLLEVAAQVILYRAIRRGEWQAKLLVAGAGAFLAYTGTVLSQGYVAGVAFRNLWGWPLLVLLKDMLTLMALVLLFAKPRMVAEPKRA